MATRKTLEQLEAEMRAAVEAYARGYEAQHQVDVGRIVVELRDREGGALLDVDDWHIGE